MEKYIAGKRSMECKQKQLGGLVRNKIKHWKKYKIGKSPTPLGKITIVLTSLVKRTIKILPSGVGDFPILYSSRCPIIIQS